jgi:LysR family transcriptional regulator, glycine cleavage system transcriptional activator
MLRIPSLDALRIFVVAARHLSFTEAASELNLTQSAVSHRIRGLEDELGLALFKRLTRRVELTTHGAALARKVGNAIAEIDRSIVELDRADVVGPLKVTMLPSVATHWLIPRLPRIRSRHPDLDVQVIADPRLLDLRAEGIDLAIRFCRSPNASYAATRLMSDRVFPVCTPELLERYGPVDSIETLLALPLLHDSATEGDGSDSDWRAWLAYHGRPDLDCHAGQRFSEGGMLINAAVLGLGVAMARASLVADQMASGALVCPLKLVAPTAFTYYLLGLPEAADRPRIVTLRQLLVQEAASTEAFTLSMDAVPSNDRSAVLAMAATA